VPQFEAEFTRSVFSAASRNTHKFELDLSGPLRGDPAQRRQSWAIAVQHGILSPDEVREERDLNVAQYEVGLSRRAL
jgi:phage portal protein BeeE